MMSELDPSFDPNVDPALAEERAHRRRLARSTAVFGAATGISRVLGLVREIVAAYTFGAAGKINAFTVAFQIPNLVRALVADTALSGAFVPVFSELLEKGERARAWRVASTIFWLVLLLTTAMTAIFVLAAPLIVELFGTPGGDFDLAVGLSRLLFPIVILLGLSGIIVGILNAYDQFTVPALTPVAWNLVIILGLVLGVPAAGEPERGALRLRGLDRARDARPAPDARALAPRARRPTADRRRLARPGGAPLLRAHAPGDADARPDQRLDADRHALRLAPDRPGPRSARDRPRLPPLHAAAGDLLGGSRHRSLPDAVATRGAR